MSGHQAILQIMCPNLTCRRILAVPMSSRGKLVRCRGCGSTVRVPELKAEQGAGENEPNPDGDDRKVA